jgi:phosphodiesterase/alkaline phosphatase D-like protein
MANTIESTRHSSSQKSLFVENAAVVALSGSAAVAIEEIEATSYDRATIQIKHGVSSGTATITAKVWGSLFDDAGTVGGANWTQIGDDITIANSTSAMKSIATTGLRKLGVTMTIASGTPNFTAGNCKVFLQGTI